MLWLTHALCAQGLAEALAAMAPCLRLYAYLGTRLQGVQPPLRSPYREWAAMYSTPAYLVQPASQEALLAHAASKHRHPGALQPALDCNPGHRWCWRHLSCPCLPYVDMPADICTSLKIDTTLR